MGDTHQTMVFVECGQHVVAVVGYIAADQHLSDDAHGDVGVQQVLVYLPLWRIAAHHDVERQRFGHAVLAHEVDHLIIVADVDIRRDGEGNLLLAQRTDNAAGLRGGNPNGQALEGVAAVAAAEVLHAGRDHGFISVIGFGGYLLDAPPQRVAVYVEVHGDGRCQQVAVQVGHVLDCYDEVGLLDRVLRHVEVDEQVLAIGHEAVLDVLQGHAAAHGGVVLARGQAVYHILGHKGVAVVGPLAGSVVAVALHTHTGGHEPLHVVVGRLVLAEAEVSEQTQLLAAEADVGGCLDHILGQCHLIHGYLVDIAVERPLHLVVAQIGGAGSQVSAVEAAQGVDGEGLLELLVEIELAHIARAAHGEGHMVPCAVVHRRIGAGLMAAQPQTEESFVHTEVEVVAVGVLCLGLSVAQNGATAVVGAEPEGHGIVVIVFAAEELRINAEALLAVECHTDAVGHVPLGILHIQVAAAAHGVVAVGAISLVQGPVVQQTQLEAREALLAVFVHLVFREGAVPESELQHLAFVVLDVVLHLRIGAAQMYVAGASVEHGVLKASYLLRSVVEAHFGLSRLNVGVEHILHLMQRAERHRIGRIIHLVADGGHQTTVGRDAELHDVVRIAVAEEGHVLAGAVGLDHQVDGERLGAQVAGRLGGGRLIAVEP